MEIQSRRVVARGYTIYTIGEDVLTKISRGIPLLPNFRSRNFLDDGMRRHASIDPEIRPRISITWKRMIDEEYAMNTTHMNANPHDDRSISSNRSKKETFSFKLDGEIIDRRYLQTRVKRQEGRTDFKPLWVGPRVERAIQMKLNKPRKPIAISIQTVCLTSEYPDQVQNKY